MNQFTAILTLLGILVCLPTHAQVKLSGQATGKHKNLIESYRQRRNQVKSLDQLEQEIDKSILKNQLPADSANYQEQIENYVEILDSAKRQAKLDSILVVKTKFQEAILADSLNGFSLDTSELEFDQEELMIIEQYAETWSNEYALNGFTEHQTFDQNLSQQMTHIDPPTNNSFRNPEAPSLDSYQNSINRLDSRSLVSTQELQEVLDRLPQENIQKALSNNATLKDEYRTLHCSNDLSSGIKRNSVEGESRLQVSGLFNVASTDPFILNSDLKLGIRLTRNWTVGTGIVMREQFSKPDSAQSFTGDAWGVLLFSSFEIGRDFFAYGEMKKLKSESIFNKNDNETYQWQTAYYIGIGREISVTKWLNMNLILVYNLNNNQNNLNPRAFEFRVGYRLNGFRIRKEK